MPRTLQVPTSSGEEVVGVGVRPGSSGRAARTRRRLLPGRSPLARAVDRVGGALVLLLVTLGGAALPAAAPAHASAVRQLEAAEQDAADGRSEVAAVVLERPVLPAAQPGGSGPGVAADQSVRVGWTGLDGNPRTALVPVDVTASVGDQVRVWADDSGVAVRATTAHERAVVAWGQVGLAVVAWWSTLLTTHLLLDAALERWRLRWWTRQWELTGPRWTSRA